MKRFGSGWTWLVQDGTGLAVVLDPNQDSRSMQSHMPLLGIDVWEHAYYLHYQNRRPDYLSAWWDVVNWDAVGRRYERTADAASAATPDSIGAPIAAEVARSGLVHGHRDGAGGSRPSGA